MYTLTQMSNNKLRVSGVIGSSMVQYHLILLLSSYP
jgi:hypothetical protein